jgi:hypothetical protein
MGYRLVTEYIYNVPTALQIPAEIACHVVAPYEANAYLGQQVIDLARVALTRQLETDTVVLDSYGVLGFAKVTRKWQVGTVGRKKSVSGYDVSIDEVLARSPRRHLGSIALYTALRTLDGSPGDRITYDGLDRNGTNQWFAKLGFRPLGPEEPAPALSVGDLHLPQTRYALHPLATQKTILRRMATKRPWLVNARVIDS